MADHEPPPTDLLEFNELLAGLVDLTAAAHGRDKVAASDEVRRGERIGRVPTRRLTRPSPICLHSSHTMIRLT